MKRSSKIDRLGYVFILSGLALTFLGLWLNQEFQTVGSLAFSIGIEFLKDFGIAVVTLGLLGIIVNLRDWQAYFKERLADVVMHKDYLQTLEESELISIQTSALRALFRDAEIGREGSLLTYFQSRVQHLIGEPYRENLKILARVSQSESGEIIIQETWTYTCRKVGARIQPYIMWEPRPAKIRKVIDINISLLPKLDQGGILTGESVIVSEEPLLLLNKEELEQAKRENAYFVDISDKGHEDGLRARYAVEYVQPRRLFLSWTMAFPTKGFSVAVRYDDRLRLEYEIIGFNTNEGDVEDYPGIFSLAMNDWVLPDCGVVVQFRDPERDDLASSRPQEEPAVG